MRQKTLAVMAAGLGSRFGGLKQVHAVVNNYAILDFSVYDALQAGFNHIVFIVNEDLISVFKTRYLNVFPEHIKVDITLQDTSGLPKRKRPWGTGHALLSLKKLVHNNFALINADDFYGRDAFKLMHDALYADTNKQNYFIGYPLKNTLSDFGAVSRGVCILNKNQDLKHIVEHTNISKENLSMPLDTIVSMNFWGFTPEVFNIADSLFATFLTEHKNSQTAEFFIPQIVDFMINEYDSVFKMLETSAKWFGVTYKEDEAKVKEQLQELISLGIYPKTLW